MQFTLNELLEKYVGEVFPDGLAGDAREAARQSILDTTVEGWVDNRYTIDFKAETDKAVAEELDKTREDFDDALYDCVYREIEKRYVAEVRESVRAMIRDMLSRAISS